MSFRAYSAVFTGALFLLAAWALWESRIWPIQASLMAWLIGVPTAVLLAVQLLREILGRPDEAAPAQGQDEGLLDAALAGQAAEPVDPAEERRRTAGIIGWILAFAAAIWLVGFPLGITLMTLLYLKSAGESWLTVIGLTVGVFAGIVLVFDCGMHIFFAEGKLFTWAGLSTSPLFTSICYQVSSLFKG